MPEPRYKQLVDRLADDIRAGRLRPGTRLPAHRDLAARERFSSWPLPPAISVRTRV
ncbi:GntR family transcriptional regulator [Paraburkholderia sp. RL17-337-BIB-A]|uniref:GntR family transcriptional regulator n=1 Tax=Paraburkholderia sp. RL17-337-BIB-A TaxID=3031636 RepID=UPI0038B90C14